MNVLYTPVSRNDTVLVLREGEATRYKTCSGHDSIVLVRLTSWTEAAVCDFTLARGLRERIDAQHW
jgi:hypothetical protein